MSSSKWPEKDAFMRSCLNHFFMLSRTNTGPLANRKAVAFAIALSNHERKANNYCFNSDQLLALYAEWHSEPAPTQAPTPRCGDTLIPRQ